MANLPKIEYITADSAYIEKFRLKTVQYTKFLCPSPVPLNPWSGRPVSGNLLINIYNYTSGGCGY